MIIKELESKIRNLGGYRIYETVPHSITFKEISIIQQQLSETEYVNNRRS